MNIKEAIQHCRDVAGGCPAGDRDCAYQHDQLADWLEELVAYRAAMPLERVQELAQPERDGRLVVLPPNDPLTLEELREMDGDPCTVASRRKEQKMENKAKPRICEVLGVDIGQAFWAITPYTNCTNWKIDHDGEVVGKGLIGGRSLCYMINHPECIHTVHRWTPEEVELAKAIKVMWPETDHLVRIDDLPEKFIRVANKDGYTITMMMEAYRFPSLTPDETVLISDIIGGEENG